MTTETKINVAPSSTKGHYVNDAKNVIEIDNINETFFVEGKSKLTSENHTSLDISEDCLITRQKVYNPFSEMFEKVKD